METDQGHLQILSVCYYISGALGIIGAVSLFAFLGAGREVLDIFAEAARNPQPDHLPGLTWLGNFFTAFFCTLALASLVFAACTIAVGRYLTQHTGYTFCLVVAGVHCLSMPFGTILGVCTFIVLFRPSVRVMFGVDPPPRQPTRPDHSARTNTWPPVDPMSRDPDPSP